MKVVNQQTSGLSTDRLFVIIQILTIVMLIIVGVFFYLEITKPQQKYYLEYINKPLTNITPFDRPNILTNALLKWAALAATNIYTIDFVDYQKILDGLRQYFTTTGYSNFLVASRNRLNDIIAQKLITAAVVSGTPVLLKEGLIGELDAWLIQVPLSLSYQGASEHITRQDIVVKLLIVCVPTKEASAGIGIAQIEDVPISEY